MKSNKPREQRRNVVLCMFLVHYTQLPCGVTSMDHFESVGVTGLLNNNFLLGIPLGIPFTMMNITNISNNLNRAS